MALHAMSDVTGITIHEENGGCGQPHIVEVDADGVRTLECPICEPVAQALGYGWSANPKSVLSTPDEVAEHERLEKESARLGAQNLISQLRGAAGQQVQVIPDAFLAQMAAMQQAMEAQQAQIAELTAKLTAQPDPSPSPTGEPPAGEKPAGEPVPVAEKPTLPKKATKRAVVSPPGE